MIKVGAFEENGVRKWEEGCTGSWLAHWVPHRVQSKLIQVTALTHVATDTVMSDAPSTEVYGVEKLCTLAEHRYPRLVLAPLCTRGSRAKKEPKEQATPLYRPPLCTHPNTIKLDKY